MTIPYYQTFGDKTNPALLLLHSGGMCGMEWKNQIEEFKKRYYLLIPDLPGHGKTLLNGKEFKISTLAEAAISLLEVEKIDRTAICGSSLGAATAMYISLKYKEKIAAAVFFRMSYRKNIGAYQQTCKMAEPEYWKKYGMHKWLSEIHEPQGGENAWEEVIKRVQNSLNPEITEHNHKLEDFQNIDFPVLIISGDRDPVSPLEDAIALHNTIKTSSLWIMPDTDHITATNTWRSDIFSTEIMRFLRSKYY